MVLVLSAILVVACVGVALYAYTQRTIRPGGWSREDRIRALSEVTPENLEANYQRQQEDGPTSD